MYRYVVSYALQTEAGYTLASQVLDRAAPVDGAAALQQLCADLARERADGGAGAAVCLLRLTLISEPAVTAHETATGAGLGGRLCAC